MPLLMVWGTSQTVLLIIGAVVAIVLIVMMSTKKPGPEGKRGAGREKEE